MTSTAGSSRRISRSIFPATRPRHPVHARGRGPRRHAQPLCQRAAGRQRDRHGAARHRGQPDAASAGGALRRDEIPLDRAVVELYRRDVRDQPHRRENRRRPQAHRRDHRLVGQHHRQLRHADAAQCARRHQVQGRDRLSRRAGCRSCGRARRGRRQGVVVDGAQDPAHPVGARQFRGGAVPDRHQAPPRHAAASAHQRSRDHRRRASASSNS